MNLKRVYTRGVLTPFSSLKTFKEIRMSKLPFTVASNRFVTFAGFTIDLYAVYAVSQVVQGSFAVYTTNKSFDIKADNAHMVRTQFISAWRASMVKQAEQLASA